MPTEDEPSLIPEFDPKLMNEALDASEESYPALLEKHKREEEERANQKAEWLRNRSIFRKLVDALIPA